MSVINEKIQEELLSVLSEDKILLQEPMKKHTTFRVGGPADCYVMPETNEEIKEVIACCKANDIPYYILGNGSNLLVADRGYRGVIIQIFKNMNQVEVDGTIIRAQAGALLSSIAGKALEASLAGFEFASGIPGTIGGACVMNAGAYGGEMKQIVREVTVLDSEGNILVLPAEKMEFGYRTSVIAKNGYVVLGAEIELQKGNANEIKAVMDELKEKRVTKQPLEFPSAGSTFKRPEGYFAGKLIQDAGLRGFMVGDAQVSEKHCGFVINRGNATAAEILSLMEQVSERVEEKFGVRLEPEVKRLGEF